MAIIPRSSTEAVRTAQLAETAGFDAVWLGDTLGDWIDPSQPFLDPWPLLGLFSARTERITLGTLVTNVAWRPPEQIARWAMTVDQIAGGRFELGVGCGYVDDQRMAGPEVVAMPGSERVARLDEGLHVLDRLLRGDTSRFEGRFTSWEVAAMAPGCVRAPRVPLIVAGVGERVMRLAARHADRWNTFIDTSDITDFGSVAGQRLRKLDELCEREGRDPRSLGRGLTLFFEAIDAWADEDALVRTVEQFVEVGFDEFVIYPPNEDQLGRFKTATNRLHLLR